MTAPHLTIESDGTPMGTKVFLDDPNDKEAPRRLLYVHALKFELESPKHLATVKMTHFLTHIRATFHRIPPDVIEALKIVNDWMEQHGEAQHDAVDASRYSAERLRTNTTKRGLIFQINKREDLAKGW